MQQAPIRSTHRRAGLVAVVLALVAVAVAVVVGVAGLFGNPVHGTSTPGVDRLVGTFDPFTAAGSAAACTACSEGYVRDGARSVFVVFPATCAPLRSGVHVDVTARLDTTLGNASYRATGCNQG